MPTNRVREILGEHGEDIDAEFHAAWDFGGATYVRLCMSVKLATLESLYHEIKTGVELTAEQRDNRFKSLDIGLDEEALDIYCNQREEQKKAQINDSSV